MLFAYFCTIFVFYLFCNLNALVVNDSSSGVTVDDWVNVLFEMSLLSILVYFFQGSKGKKGELPVSFVLVYRINLLFILSAYESYFV